MNNMFFLLTLLILISASSSSVSSFTYAFELGTTIRMRTRSPSVGPVVPSPSPSSPSSCSRVLQLSSRRRRNQQTIHYTKINNGRDDESDDGEIPNMDWLTKSPLMTDSKDRHNADDDSSDDDDIDFISIPMDDDDRDEEDVARVIAAQTNPIPTTGVSVADEMEYAQRDRYYSEVVPIVGLPPSQGGGGSVFAAQIATATSGGSYEPVRYLVRLSSAKEESNKNDSGDDIGDEDDCGDVFVMIDVPPFSPKLLKEIQDTMKDNNTSNSNKETKKKSSMGRLAAILITNEDGIHLNDDMNDIYASVSPGRRKKRQEADLASWVKAFPGVEVVANRMDVPRYCRDIITQRLDGYGPWAAEMTDTTTTAAAKNEDHDYDDDEDHSVKFEFLETGRPLARKELDVKTARAILSGKMKPPEVKVQDVDDNDDGEFSKVAIRAKEEGKDLLAIYTPGRTNGSMCYVFPKLKLCATGYTVPLEDTRQQTNVGIDQPGPALDFRGYITTSKAGVTRQMKSARNLVEDYSDRFEVLLPSRGDPYYVDRMNPNDRKEMLLEMIDQYAKLGRVYEQLGIL